MAAIAAADTAKSDKIGVMMVVNLSQLKGSGFLDTTIVLPGKSKEFKSFWKLAYMIYLNHVGVHPNDLIRSCRFPQI